MLLLLYPVGIILRPYTDGVATLCHFVWMRISTLPRPNKVIRYNLGTPLCAYVVLCDYALALNWYINLYEAPNG